MEKIFESPEPKLLTVQAAFRRAGISRTRLYSEIKTGRIVAVKVGRRTLIKLGSLDGWIDSLPEAKND